MKLLTRLILSHYSRILGLCCAAFVGIYLLIDFFEKLDNFIDHSATAADYLSYLINNIPLILTQILPLAVLTATVLTLGGLGHTNESTAMRSCGVSLWKIVKPLMGMALLCSLLALLLNELVCPQSTAKLNELLDYKLKGKKQVELISNEIWYRQDNKIINIASANAGEGKLHGLSILSFGPEQQIIARLDAPVCTYQDGSWIAPQAISRRFAADGGDMLDQKTLSREIIELKKKPEDFAKSHSANDELSFTQLAAMVAKLENEGYDATHQRVDMHNRLATPFTCLIMGFLGVPFALQRGRGSNITRGISLSIAVGVVYFIIQSTITSFGYAGALPPVVAAWTANLIFLLLGIWLQLNVQE
jgi:lipopolysaccharide export system permease protein